MLWCMLIESVMVPARTRGEGVRSIGYDRMCNGMV